MTPAAVQAAVVTDTGTCQKCRRRGGRNRTGDASDALFTTTAVIVCDRCWHAVGGSDAIHTTLTDSGAVEVVLAGAPEFEALLADVAEYDDRHPIDRLLISCGIRWTTLRHVAAPARCDLARWILERAPAPGTRRATSPDTWMDAVTDRIAQQSGSEFRYNAKRRRWWAIANVFRQCGQWDARPLTWISQDEVAAAIGCSTRTVRRCVAWMLREGLLHEVLPGCQVPRQATPDEETPAERAARLARRAAAVAAEEAAIARARAELAGTPVPPAAAPQDAPPPEAAEDDPDWPVWLEAAALVQLVPVYELRVPAEAADDPPPALAEPLTSDDTAAAATTPENGHPPQVLQIRSPHSRTGRPVDNRPASPGINTKEGPGRARPSEAARAAHWLLSSRLHPDLCVGVSQRWLAALIRDSRLLRDWDWTWDDLADLIHGIPEHPHLPRWIRNPRGWIKARLRSADGRLAPSKLAIIQQIERTSPAMQRRRALELDRARRAEIAALRATIAACPFCDELGWHDADPGDPGTAVFRCNHDPDTAGW